VLLGLLLGALLGAIDGATAWFTPAVRAQLAGIIIGSTVRGLIAGVAAGIFARKVNSVLWNPFRVALASYSLSWLRTCSTATTFEIIPCPAVSLE